MSVTTSKKGRRANPRGSQLARDPIAGEAGVTPSFNHVQSNCSVSGQSSPQGKDERALDEFLRSLAHALVADHLKREAERRERDAEDDGNKVTR